MDQTPIGNEAFMGRTMSLIRTVAGEAGFLFGSADNLHTLEAWRRSDMKGHDGLRTDITITIPHRTTYLQRLLSYQ